MQIFLNFIGRAESLAALYEGVGSASFALTDLTSPLQGLVVPTVGDKVALRMHPGPDIRQFLCVGRVFDFSDKDNPALRIELDMPQ